MSARRGQSIASLRPPFSRRGQPIARIRHSSARIGPSSARAHPILALLGQPISRAHRPSARRGQSITIDFIISISLFLLLLIIVYASWVRQVDRLGDELLARQAQEAAARGLSAIVDSPGFPSDWAVLNLAPDDPALLGLGAAESPGRIDDFKLARLSVLYNNSDYANLTRQKMGLGAFFADVAIRLASNSSNVSVLGSAPNSTSIVLASGTRVATYKNSTALVRVRVWRSLT